MKQTSNITTNSCDSCGCFVANSYGIVIGMALEDSMSNMFLGIESLCFRIVIGKNWSTEGTLKREISRICLVH